MHVCSNEEKKKNLFLCLCLFVDYWGKKSIRNSTQAYQTRVPYYKELELGKLEYHRRKKKRALRSSFVFTKNSSLISSSILLHGTQV